jgi:hypothetical protein
MCDFSIKSVGVSSALKYSKGFDRDVADSIRRRHIYLQGSEMNRSATRELLVLRVPTTFADTVMVTPHLIRWTMTALRTTFLRRLLRSGTGEQENGREIRAKPSASERALGYIPEALPRLRRLTKRSHRRAALLRVVAVRTLSRLPLDIGHLLATPAVDHRLEQTATRSVLWTLQKFIEHGV